MPRFIIERDLPGAGQLTPEELQSISQKSNEVLGAMAGRAQWLQSFVTDDKLYCVYIADDADTVAEHARIGLAVTDGVAVWAVMRPLRI